MRIGLERAAHINISPPTRSISVGCDKGAVYRPQRSVSLTST